MSELLFSAMDVPNEAKKILDKVEDSICKGMTDSERKAYQFGVSTTMSIMQNLLELDEEPVIHINGFDGIKEIDIIELEKIFLD